MLEQYAALLKLQRERGPPSKSSINRNAEAFNAKDGQNTLRLLATCRKRLTGRDYRKLRRVFAELETWFNVKHPVQNHHWLLLGMVRASKPDDALRWILAMPQSYGIQPGIQDWNVVLSGFSKAQRKSVNDSKRKEATSTESFQEAWRHLLESGVQPDAISYNIHLRALFSQEDHIDLQELSGLVRDMQTRRIQPDIATWSTLLEGYTSRNDLEPAREAYEQLAATPNNLDTIAWNSRLAYVGHFFGSAAVWEEWERWQSSPNRPEPDDYTFAHFLRHSTTDLSAASDPVQAARDELDLISERCALHPSPWGCATFIHRLLASTDDMSLGYQRALDFYNSIIFGPDAVMPHSLMVDPLLERLIQLESLPDKLLQAQRLFESLADGVEEGFAPDVGVCHATLRICEESGHQGVQYAFSVLDHMRQDHLTFDKAETVLQHMKGLMKASGSYQGAFKSYSWMRALDPTQLDTAAYNKILTTFSFLDFSNSNTPTSADSETSKIAPQFFLEILKDMRSTGQAPDTITYTLLLEYYSRRYKRADQIRRLHDIIKVDLQYDPDIRLHNALIVAYGYVGDYSAAVRVWQGLMANRHRPNMGITHATISAILDVCGFSGSKATAWRIFQSIRQNHFSIQMNKRNWDTWVECLGRLGCLPDACDVVERDMVDLADGDTADILFKFARRAGPEAHEQVRSRMAAARPDLLAAAPPARDAS